MVKVAETGSLTTSKALSTGPDGGVLCGQSGVGERISSSRKLEGDASSLRVLAGVAFGPETRTLLLRERLASSPFHQALLHAK